MEVSRSQDISKKPKPQPEINTPLKDGISSIQYGGLSKSEDDVPLLLTDSFSGERKRINCLQFLSTLTIEPVVFCFLFAFIMNMTCQTNFIMEKGCLHRLNFSSEVCSNMSAFPKEKEQVEKLANNFSLYASLMSLLGAFFMIFIAPWSDKYGRKAPLLLAVIGSAMTDAGLIMCALNFDSRLEYIILSKIPSEIFGGFICVLTIIYSHASEVSMEKTRTLKYTTVEIFMGLGMALGGLTGGMLYKHYGYFYVYLTSAILHLFCFPWVLFFVQETTGLDATATWLEKAKGLFACQSFKSGIKASLRPRENKSRLLLLLFFGSMCIIILTYESFASIGYVYVHHIYNWELQTYTVVYTIFSVCQMAITLVCVPVMLKFYKISDPMLGLLGTISMIGKNVIYAFAQYGIDIYYAGYVAGFLSPLSTLAVRSGISKIVDKDELGKVFSFLATFEAVVPMLGTALITKVFNATMDTVPSVTYLMTVLLLFLPLGTFMWAYARARREFAILKISCSTYEPINEKA